MLVLSRKLGEAIVIGDGIRLTVVGIQRGQVQLGLVAPANTPILRSELLKGVRRPCARKPAGAPRKGAAGDAAAQAR